MDHIPKSPYKVPLKLSLSDKLHTLREIIRKNIQVFDFQLEPEEVKEIESLLLPQ